MEVAHCFVSATETLPKNSHSEGFGHLTLQESDSIIASPPVQKHIKNYLDTNVAHALPQIICNLTNDLKEASSELLSIENDSLDVRWYLCEYSTGLKEQQHEIHEELKKCRDIYPELTERVRSIENSCKGLVDAKMCKTVNRLKVKFPNYHIQQSETTAEAWDSAMCAFEVALEDQAKYQSEIERLNVAIAKEKQKQVSLLKQHSVH